MTKPDSGAVAGQPDAPAQRGPRDSTGRRAIAIMMDTACVVVFVLLGRDAHSGDPQAPSPFIIVAAPYLIGLAAAWYLIWQRWTGRVFSVSAGLVVAGITWALGSLLRDLVFRDGTPREFLIVAALFLVATIAGWRAATGMFGGRSRESLS